MQYVITLVRQAAFSCRAFRYDFNVTINGARLRRAAIERALEAYRLAHGGHVDPAPSDVDVQCDAFNVSYDYDYEALREARRQVTQPRMLRHQRHCVTNRIRTGYLHNHENR